ncbi:uncharacterized protein Tco025E_10057, partial [Trypanosoma conorhini]
LHWPLHRDECPLHFVLCCLGGELADVFDTATQTARGHEGELEIRTRVSDLSWRARGCIVSDAPEEGAPLPWVKLRPCRWGMIARWRPQREITPEYWRCDRISASPHHALPRREGGDGDVCPADARHHPAQEEKK